MEKRAPIAVVGMAGLFPGASDLNLFWENIINKVDSTCDIPEDRWIVEPRTILSSDPVPDKAISKRACLIRDFKFDPEGINLDKALLEALDPLYQIILHTGRQALLNCSVPFNRERTGTVLAAIALPTDTSSFITREIMGRAFEEKLFGNFDRDKNLAGKKPLSREECLAGRVTSFPAAILANSLGLGGGSYTLDAACASSLYAVKLACDELYLHRADAMLAGGVSRPDCLYTQVGFSQLRALSPSGRCAPFDESADGLVVGEGAGILVLKRFDDAMHDGDRIYGLIHGIGLSNDMRGNLLAPDSEGQERAMRGAYERAGWSPHDIDLIECHGAGTPVGDAIELQSLRNLWGESGWKEGECALGSIKSMIGHLLTGAGAAGLIKTLLAINHKILPPSLNFYQAPAKSPLYNSPFRVQCEAEEWTKKTGHRPRRAAVSAFGFGGINGHILIEEFHPSDAKIKGQKQKIKAQIPGSMHRTREHPGDKPPAVAITGMETSFGPLTSLRDFQETIFKGESIIGKRPEKRWRGCDKTADMHIGGELPYGGFMEKLILDFGEFHIPPNEIPDILPQHLLMLKVAAGAMKDAGLSLRENRPRMGTIIGMGFDFGATDFHLRWNLQNAMTEWDQANDFDPEPLKNAYGPPLTSNRTLGALGGIIASRIAREFCFGGPSFVVSGEETSGLKALEIGIRFLQQNEADAVLVGAVDLTGDVRSIVTSNQIRPYTRQSKIHPFDTRANGTLPGEGAAAIVLKRLDRAIEDRDRIYAVIKGTGNASGGGIEIHSCSEHLYSQSLKRALSDADIPLSSISLIETHGSGSPSEDKTESKALNELFNDTLDDKTPCAIGSVKPNIGHTGAVAGLASLIKTSLCLYQEIVPPLLNYIEPENNAWRNSTFHFPAYPHYWLRNRKDGPRRACVGAMTSDGNFMHVILEGFEYTAMDHIPEMVDQERKKPLGLNPFGLFIVEGNSKGSLVTRLDELAGHANQWSKEEINIESAAGIWNREYLSDPGKKLCVSIVAGEILYLEKSIKEAKKAIAADSPRRMNSAGGVCYAPEPLAPTGETAFVFPGSGNHYIGMGREIGVYWPEVLRRMDRKTPQLMKQLVPECYVPFRTSWAPGWEEEAQEKIVSDPLNMIFGQVVHGSLVAGLIKDFGIKPSAVIGYSLGESAGLFAMGAWSDRDAMLERMLDTDLFTRELAGPCNAVRNAWNLPLDEDINWCAAVVNRPTDIVQKIITGLPFVRLLITNTPDQCVIGGKRDHVETVIDRLGCEAVFLDGVVAVHCDAAMPVADAYENLHIFPTTPPEGIRFYSCALERSYDLTSRSAASSIRRQAVAGFDFTKTIEQAYRDGIRIFLEMGPHSSCTGMIDKILKNQPHLALSACVRGENGYLTVLKFIGALISERVPVDMDKLYGIDSYIPHKKKTGKQIIITIGGKEPEPLQIPIPDNETIDRLVLPEHSRPKANRTFSGLIASMTKNIEATTDAHKAFLNFSAELSDTYAKTLGLQTQLLISQHQKNKAHAPSSRMSYAGPGYVQNSQQPDRPALFSREMCLEFAVGSVAKVLGPEFAVVDTYNYRVRLPDEPLMLVDRIINVEGEKKSLNSGRVITEHDVLPDAWYLDGDRAPVCISVEAGQADLFLCSYLGIDHAIKGERAYRLLDATVEFHRGLPRPGDIIRYEIKIEKFVRQDKTYLFFFNFIGYIGDNPLITMTNGCAGFFTQEEVKNSGGIILTEGDTEPDRGKKPSDWVDLVPIHVESYSEKEVEALRKGDLSSCFGDHFCEIELTESLRLPAGRMKLIDRILRLDPEGGRYGLGMIRAEADIHPDDWFLTCHFMDDMVMPGTLMYECCAHTLRVFIQRMGWVSEKPGVCYEPVIGVKSILKCRGPVTPDTKSVIYEIEIKEIGYAPEPYVIADAHMYADDLYIVTFKDISMKMTGITGAEIESFWKARKADSDIQYPGEEKEILFDREKLLAFSTGKPSEAFGNRYRPFDAKRFIARLPAPPFLFIDRIMKIEPEQWVLKPDGWIEAEFDVDPDAWYFRANRVSSIPFVALLEIALQPCGWLAAYMGSALKNDKDLKFRNLGGTGIMHNDISPDYLTLTTRARSTRVSEAGDMIIEQFDFELLHRDRMIYAGDTNFGFFTNEALTQQAGIRDAAKRAYIPAPEELQDARSYIFEDVHPLFPGDDEIDSAPSLAMPAKALRMIDTVETYIPDGGPHGLGFIRGVKKVDPKEWFFRAHFHQDPVCPGSLGIESFLQLLKFIALDRWKHLAKSHKFEIMTEKQHKWTYRGQIIPENARVEVEAVVTGIQDTPLPSIQADGFLKIDGLYIYEMNNFGIKLVPHMKLE